jgi:hypothetical protein
VTGRGARRRAGGRGSSPAVNWALGVTQLAAMLIFVAYFVCVQVNAVAFLTGTRRAVIGGTAPPVPLTGTGAAAADCAAGLLIEALSAVDLVIMVLFAVAGIREARGRHRPPAPARTPGVP